MDIWSLQSPVPVTLAALAAMGYLFGRRSRTGYVEMLFRSQRELRRARAVAGELEKIAWSVRKNLARHHASVSTFKDRVARLSDAKKNLTG